MVNRRVVAVRDGVVRSAAIGAGHSCLYFVYSIYLDYRLGNMVQFYAGTQLRLCPTKNFLVGVFTVQRRDTI